MPPGVSARAQTVRVPARVVRAHRPRNLGDAAAKPARGTRRRFRKRRAVHAERNADRRDATVRVFVRGVPARDAATAAVHGRGARRAPRVCAPDVALAPLHLGLHAPHRRRERPGAHARRDLDVVREPETLAARASAPACMFAPWRVLGGHVS